MSKLKKLLFLYFILLIVYSVFSFSLTDPNLVFTSWMPYIKFQQFMWDSFFSNSQLLTLTYISIISIIFAVYVSIIKTTQNLDIKIGPKQIFLYFLLISPLLLSYNALSHDVFNYIFNAKMVMVYEANPHIQVALDFPNDEWVRFMHNTHTPAPYGYGWTAFSLMPYLMGLGKFVPTWLIFRLTSLLSIFLLFFTIKLLSKRLNIDLTIFKLSVLFLNPLFIIEVISNMHNDLWMMMPAMLSLALLLKTDATSKKKITKTVIFITVISALLMLFSVSTKIATILLVPLWFLLFFVNKSPKLIHTSIKLNQWWPTLASFAMFIPLMTSRSQQFHPWYLLWIMVWLPFTSISVWKRLILIFSVTSLFRYAPWMWVGGFEEKTLFYQKLITWGVPFIYLVWHFVFRDKKSKKKNSDAVILKEIR